jgi:hypothetical protein
MTRLILTACGKQKRAVPSRASDLYTGRYARLPISWAMSVDPDATLILSAKHGLLRPDDIVEPYDLAMGDPGSVTSVPLRRQAAQLGILDADPVHVLPMNVRYRRLIALVWPHAVRILPGDGGHWTSRLAANLGRDVDW